MKEPDATRNIRRMAANRDGNAQDGNRSGVREGIVHLVGAGPGDADLLTLRALRVLRRAQVVVYDELLGTEILDFADPGAERIHAGKRKGEPGMPQAAINRLLCARARAGQRVVRLKGGDPFVFGRGGEELEYLRRAGVRVEIVPGVTAALGCAAAAGIPLTHRDLARSCLFVTGHTQDGRLDLDWESMAKPGQTLAVYMGRRSAGVLARHLIDHGRAVDTPVAVVENGTRPGQRVSTGRLEHLGRLAALSGAGPALILIGEVVRLREGGEAREEPVAGYREPAAA